MSTVEISTQRGPARVHLRPVDEPRAVLVLGHGAGGGVTAADLVGAASAAGEHGLSVALVEQPYRVAGRRSPAPATQLDAVWIEVVGRLLAREPAGLPLVAGGRSSGARVACRTSGATGAVGVLCLAFPLQPPRRAAANPAASRLAELEAVSVPTLVVQGARDPFGIPPPGEQRTVALVQSDHSLRSDLPALRSAVGEWLERVLG